MTRTRSLLVAIGVIAFASALVSGLPAVTARAQSGASNARGEALFGLCTQCHGPEAAGNELFLAPAIAGMDQWYIETQLRKFRSGARGTHPDDLSGMRMRPMSRTLRSDEDLTAVAAYVSSLPKADPEPTLEGGNAAAGAATYALCASCHGPAGEGNKDLNGPGLANQSDWYLFSQLHKFKAGVRGSNPKDPIAIMMRPMALTLADDQAMLDVIAHIRTLGE